MHLRALKPGLRLRVALTLALTCTLVVAALGITIYTASEELEESLIDQLVAEEMDYLVQRHREDPGYRPQHTSNLQNYIVRGAQERAQLPAFLRELAPGRYEFFVGNDEYHALVREDGDVRYYVAYEVGLYEQREREFKLLLLLLVLTAALASLALGYGFSGVLVSQVTELAGRVSSLRPGQRRGTLARAGQDAEVAMLARALDDYEARIEEMIRREQEFTANASHELRTPLTAIKTSCELLLADPALGEKSRARVVRMSEAAARMAEQIRALLFLARGQALGAVEPVALADCAAEAAESYRAEIERKGLRLEVAVGSDETLAVDAQALHLVLANLVRNAVRHTEHGFVRITYAARRLTVSDSGTGIAREHLPRLFERFYRAEDEREGHGIGLAIVKHICDQYGWRFEVASEPERGSSFTITFPGPVSAPAETKTRTAGFDDPRTSP